MPKIPHQIPVNPDLIPERPPVMRPIEPKPKPRPPRGNTPIYIQETDIDLKLKVLSDEVYQNFLPLDFEKNPTITAIDPSELAETAYIFVDNNGTPTKVLAPSVLKTVIEWDDLSADLKARLQQKLTAGAHINIDENNIISADIGVETINGKTGIVNLTAGDLNAYNKEEVFNKEETQTLLDELTVTVDGGAYYE